VGASIVDRFLEHSRILHFHHGGEEQVFMSTADWMPRNLDKRIELLIPIIDKPSKKRCIEILDACFTDNVNAWKLNVSHTYTRKKNTKKSFIRSQEKLYTIACTLNQTAKKARRTVFEPYRSKTTQ
jgi:polyphosphate kinase